MIELLSHIGDGRSARRHSDDPGGSFETGPGSVRLWQARHDKEGAGAHAGHASAQDVPPS